jgi:hypothetical protein
MDITIVKDEAKNVAEDVVASANEWYNGSESCDYILPVAETKTLHYVIVKDVKEDTKDKYNVVEYCL